MAGLYGSSSSGSYGAAVDSQRRQYAAFQQLPPEQQQALLAQIQGTDFGPPAKEDEESFFGKLVPNIVEKAAGDIGTALIQTIPGMAYAAEQIGGDVIRGEYSPVNMAWDVAHGRNPLPTRSRGLGADMLTQTATDFRHPLRHPGYTLLDIASVATLGAGAAARGAVAASRLSEGLGAIRTGRIPPGAAGGRVARPMPRPGGPGAAIGTEPPPGYIRLYRGEGERTREIEARSTTGRYFSDSYETAAAHASGQTGGGVHYVDVPQEAARPIRVGRDNEYLIHRDLADQMKPVPRLSTDPLDVMGAPSRTISEVVAGAGHEQPGLTRGIHYDVTGPGGAKFQGYFVNTKDVRGTRFHEFRTIEGKAKVIPESQVKDLMITPKVGGQQQITKLTPEERIDLTSLPPRTSLPQPYRVPMPKKEAGVAGRFAEKVEEAPKGAGEVQLEEAAATAIVPKKPAAAPKPKEPPRPYVEPKFSGIPNEPGTAAASVGEFARVVVRPKPDASGRYMITHEEKGTILEAREAVDLSAAAQQAKQWAREIANPHIKGGEVPSLGRVLKYSAGALFERPPSKLRQIEQFHPEEPRYLTPGPVDKMETVKDVAGREFPMYRTAAPKALKTEAGEVLIKPPPQPRPVGAYSGGEKWERPKPGEVIKQMDKEDQPRLFPDLEAIPENQVHRLLPRTGWRGQKPGERVVDTGTIERTNVIVSRNPGVALAQNIWIDILEKHPDLRVGPYGRDMARYIKFHKAEEKRALTIIDAAREAGLNKQVQALEAVEKKYGPGSEQWMRVLDSMNMTAKLWLLYLKPGYYVANIIGQSLLNIADHAWSPRSMAHSVKMQWEMARNKGEWEFYTAMVRKGMGESGVSLATNDPGIGIVPGLREKLPAVGPTIRGKKRELRNIGTYKGMSQFANKLLDTPFRDNAFFTEARRHGYDSWPKIKRLMDDAVASDPAAIEKLTEIYRRANRNIIDYARLGSAEKKYVRRIMFFYPWFKGATVWTGHFFAEHPMQAYIAHRLGVEGEEWTKRTIGPIPSYLKGVFKVGEREVPGLPGKQPLIVNPQAVTVLGTPGQVLNSAMAALAGGGNEASALSQYFTPAISAGIAATTHVDPFTGAPIDPQKGVFDIAAEQMIETAAPLKIWGQVQRANQIASGELDPSRILLPYSQNEPYIRFATGVSPYTLNAGEARSRAFAEQTSLASRREREVLKNQDYRNRYAEAGKSTGLFTDMPPELTTAFAQRAQLYAETAAAEAGLNRPMRMIDRLQALMGLLVRSGKMDAEQARATLMQMAQLPDSQVETYKSKLTNAYFGGEIISRYRAALNASGAGLTVP